MWYFKKFLEYIILSLEVKKVKAYDVVSLRTIKDIKSDIKSDGVRMLHVWATIMGVGMGKNCLLGFAVKKSFYPIFLKKKKHETYFITVECRFLTFKLIIQYIHRTFKRFSKFNGNHFYDS